MSGLVYVITTGGKKHRYATLPAASAVASEIFKATGVVVGIEAEPGKTRAYTLDIVLKASVTVQAASADEAMRQVQTVFECADCNGGAWRDGSPVLFEASLAERPSVGMIDGDVVQGQTLRDLDHLRESGL